jgi:hypothetical protein
MILDDPIECPRCGKKTKLVDTVQIGDRVVMHLCTVCSEKPVAMQLDKLLIQFRHLVKGISNAVDKHCPECAGRGWRAYSRGRGLRDTSGMCRTRCVACVGTGVDMAELLRVLEIDEKPKPVKHEPADGFSPGQAAGSKKRD